MNRQALFAVVWASLAVAGRGQEAVLTARKPPSAKPFQRIENCGWKADRLNDGDSFHVVTCVEERGIVAGLYFVDTPEAETAYRDRIDEQAAYFGITREQAVDLALLHPLSFRLDLRAKMLRARLCVSDLLRRH